MAQFKFQQDPAWASALALLMRSAPGVEDALATADLLLPMPLSAQRLAERGFNQALLLAKALDARKTLALDPLRAASLRGRKVLLIDDVMTSGASLNTAAQVLKQAGVQSVKGLVFARTEM